MKPHTDPSRWGGDEFLQKHHDESPLRYIPLFLEKIRPESSLVFRVTICRSRFHLREHSNQSGAMGHRASHEAYSAESRSSRKQGSM